MIPARGPQTRIIVYLCYACMCTKRVDTFCFQEINMYSCNSLQPTSGLGGLSSFLIAHRVLCSSSSVMNGSFPSAHRVLCRRCLRRLLSRTRFLPANGRCWYVRPVRGFHWMLALSYLESVLLLKHFYVFSAMLPSMFDSSADIPPFACTRACPMRNFVTIGPRPLQILQGR